MKNDRSKKDILEIYEWFGNNLTVISFKDGKRTMTYVCLSLYKALAEKLRNESIGRQSFIIWTRTVSKNEENNIDAVRLAANNFQADFCKMVKER